MLIQSNESALIRGLFDVSSGSVIFKAKQLLRSWHEQTDLDPVATRLSEAKVHDSPFTQLPAAAAADDLGFSVGTYGTDGLKIVTSDAKAATVSQKVRFAIPVDSAFFQGESMTLRVYCGMDTTVSDGTATIDLQCYVLDGDGTAGSDVCATDAQSINSLTNDSKDFTLTTSSIVHGDMLDCVLTIDITDAASVTAVIGAITGIKLLRDVR